MLKFVFAVIAFLRETEQVCDALLRCEENAGKIAESQGKIAGCGLLTAKIKKHFSLTDLDLKVFTEKYPCWLDLTKPTLDEFDAELKVILASEEYKAFMIDIEAENDFKKNWLWLQAEKGRDLIYVRGWKDAMQSFDEVITQFQTAYKKKMQELQFDADEKADAAYTPPLQFPDQSDFSDAAPPVIDEDQPDVADVTPGSDIAPDWEPQEGEPQQAVDEE